MKKVIVCLLVVIMMIGIYGCESYGGEDKGVFEAMKKEGIIDKNLKLVDEATEVNTVLFRTENTYSIYENYDSELIAIFYNENGDSEKDYAYTIVIYEEVTEVDVEYIDDASGLDLYCYYKDGKKSETNKYEMSDNKLYYVYEEKGMFGSIKYRFEEKE